VHMRVVRFTDVDVERMRSLRERLDERGGPPEGARVSAVQFLFDESQRTVVVIQHFASREDMEEGARVFDAMDPADTPGTRASVDACELLAELHA
jgi:hypothetical protein